MLQVQIAKENKEFSLEEIVNSVLEDAAKNSAVKIIDIKYAISSEGLNGVLRREAMIIYEI